MYMAFALQAVEQEWPLMLRPVSAESVEADVAGRSQMH